MRCLVQLSQSTGGLHVSNFEVVAQVAISEFIEVLQIAELLLKAFSAGVVFARLAIKIELPVAKTLSNGFGFAIVCKHRDFTHGDVVLWVKAERVHHNGVVL